MLFFSPSSVHTEGNHTNCWRLGLIEGSHEWLCLSYRQSRSVPDKSSLRYFHGRFWLPRLAQIGAALAPVRSVCSLLVVLCVRVGGIVALLIFTLLAQSSPHFVRVISRCGGALILISLAQPALCIGESFPKGPLHNDPMSSLKSSCTCGFF